MSETERHITSFSSVSLNWSTNLLSICSEETQSHHALGQTKEMRIQERPRIWRNCAAYYYAVACSAQPRSLDVGLETPLAHSCQWSWLWHSVLLLLHLIGPISRGRKWKRFGGDRRKMTWRWLGRGMVVGKAIHRQYERWLGFQLYGWPYTV